MVEIAAAYLAGPADAGLKASTIAGCCAAIVYAHKLAGHEPPTNAEPVKAVMRGICRRIGTAPERKAPATAKAIAGMLKRIPDAPPGLRDRALLLIGFSAALRRSEIVALNLADIAPRQAAWTARRCSTRASTPAQSARNFSAAGSERDRVMVKGCARSSLETVSVAFGRPVRIG
jgi:site-specific recombinase XerD